MAGYTHPYSTHGDMAVSAGASDLVIAAGFERIGLPVDRYPYIPDGNPLRPKNCLPYIESFFPNQPIQADVEELANYALLSSAVHLLTGWRYLSQSASAYVEGAKQQALHLAYYAELRAAMAILADSGICILNTKHYSIDSLGAIAWFEGGTHEMVWRALNKWISTPLAVTKITESLSFEGFTAREWAQMFSDSASASALLVAQWVKKWSIDIESLTFDRRYRNVASYRPNLQEDAHVAFAKTDIHFVCDIARACQLGTGYFDSLDRAIIFHLAKRTVETRDGNFSKGNRKRFFNRLRKALVNQKGLTTSAANLLIESLRSAHATEAFNLIRTAEARRDDTQAVISRALFLLRLASGIIRNQWDAISQQNAMNGFPNSLTWQRNLLLEFSKSGNVWFDDVNPPPSNDYSILVNDHQDALDEIDSWMSAYPFDRERILVDLAFPIRQISRLDRLGIVAINF